MRLGGWLFDSFPYELVSKEAINPWSNYFDESD